MLNENTQEKHFGALEKLLLDEFATLVLLQHGRPAWSTDLPVY